VSVSDPHVKTNKSIDVTRRNAAARRTDHGVHAAGRTDYFAGHGLPGHPLCGLQSRPTSSRTSPPMQAQGVRSTLILDSMEAARHAGDEAKARGSRFDLLIEIDSDGHRSGLRPDAPELLEIAQLPRWRGIARRA